jgi:glutamate synthase (NADPH/NADH) small chain
MAAARPDARLDALTCDLHPPLSLHEAGVESDRCYFCHDAPCVTACPTGIDIPLFIRQIATGDATGSAKTILAENIFGGMCARVCPTETLCEQACVRNTAEDKPVAIGELQRHATDALMARGPQPFSRASASGKRVAVVGAGPAGISCAHRLAMHGHDVQVLDSRPKAGGLNEYGIAAYKTVDDFAQRELEWIIGIGGINVSNDQILDRDFTLDSLRSEFDAVFLGLGLSATNSLGIPSIDATGVQDAVDFIAELRQATEPSRLNVGKQIVVIGGGMTAVDAAVQSKLLGAGEVTLVYRRDESAMNASDYERNLARLNGVVIKTGLSPARVLVTDAKVAAVEFTPTDASGASVVIPADQVLTAIGQQFTSDGLALALEGKKLKVDEQRRTSDANIWAGGDCAAGGEDLTVTAVQDGKLAAESIHRALSA